MLGSIRDWFADMRAICTELDRVAEADRPPVMAQITYYGRLGEMGHIEDRADDWPGADTGIRTP